jgi:hypothetical protein
MTHETQFNNKFGVKLCLPCPFFSWMFSTSHCSIMCIVIINVFEPNAFNNEFQYFIPLFNKISWVCEQQPKGDEASNEGCNLGPTRHDFMDSSNDVEMMASGSSTFGLKKRP